jgi:heptosyltransferase-1
VTRILILRLSALGDVIHTIPAVIALREATGAEIGWAVERPYADLVETVAGVQALPASIRKWGRALIASRHDIRAFIRSTRAYDTSIDFQGLVKSASIGWVAGAHARYGFERRAIREKPAGLFINHPVAIDQSRHVVEWNLQLASAVAGRPLSMPAVDFTKFVGQAIVPVGQAILPVQGADRQDRLSSIVVLPGAGKANKQWPPERFGELARRLGRPAIAAWGPNERALAERTGLELAPPTDLRQLAAILKDATLVIGGDTGPLHLAAALGTRVIGLYGPTKAARNGPYGQLDRVVSASSMDAITVDDVVKINLV